MTTAPAPDPLAAADALVSRLRARRTEPATSSQLEALALAVTANQPVLLWGEPGIGKSAGLEQLAAGLGLPWRRSLRASTSPRTSPGCRSSATTRRRPACPWPRRTGRCGSGTPGTACCSSTSCPPRRFYRAGGAAAGRAGTPGRQPGPARRGADRRRRQPAVERRGRLAPQPAARQPLRPPPLDPRPGHGRARHGRNLAGGDGPGRRPRQGPRCGGAGARRRLRFPHRPPRPGPPASRRRGGPWPLLAVPAHLGDGAAAAGDGLRDLRGPGGHGRRAHRGRRGRRRYRAAVVPGAPGPARPRAGTRRPRRVRAPGPRRPATGLPHRDRGRRAERPHPAPLGGRLGRAGQGGRRGRAGRGRPCRRRPRGDAAKLDWPVPPGIDAFLDLLQLSGALPGGR